MEAKKRILSYQYREARDSLLKFWATMVIVNILILILNMTGDPNSYSGMTVGIQEGETLLSVAGVNLMAILVYLVVHNYENYYKGFPLAISLSTTRKNFASSLVVKAGFISLVSAIIQALLFKLDPIIVGWAGKEVLYDFHIFHSQKDNILYIIFVIFIFSLAFSSISRLVASLNYRFGYVFWIGYLVLYLVFFYISPLREINTRFWLFITGIFTERVDLLQGLKLGLLILVSQFLAYLNTISINIRHRAG